MPKRSHRRMSSVELDYSVTQKVKTVPDIAED